MGLSGNLRTMSAGDLLQWLGLAIKTGTLVVTSKGIEKKVFFRKGRVISSASNDPREYLGQFLMSHGYINEEELKKAMEVQRQSRILLGKILVTIGAIGEDDLIRLMRLKAEEEIYDVFLWEDGDFHFADDELPTMPMVPFEVDLTGVIMEGTRRADEWPVIKRFIPSGDFIPAFTIEPDSSHLSEMKRLIVQAINGHRSINEIVLESRSSSFHVSRTICEFVKEGKLRLLTPRIESAPEAVAIESEKRRAEDEVTSLLGRAQKALRDGDFEKAIRALKAAGEIDPENEKVRNATRGAETVIAQELRNHGIVEKKIPALVKSIDEISEMNFSPNEGFILSRINGAWDIGSITKVSPMREIDALLIFYHLHKRAVIELRDVRA